MKEFSTYSKEDVIFLLKDISNMIVEEDNLTRERKIQSGTHYSEMIPVEYQVSDEYLTLYREKLKENKEKLAFAIGVMSEKILKRHNQNPILVSLARAGTPIGILAKRYIKQRYNIDLPHYTISIIRDRGIDINAIKYIINKHHNSQNIQFIDGWTGKGTIANELKKACIELENTFNTEFDPSLAVLADPCGYSNIYGMRDDFLIPSDKITQIGNDDVENIKDKYDIDDINFIKPGVGETTRVLLRRVPYKILVDDINNKKLKHILVLAKEKNVKVEEFKFKAYSCCGIIKQMKDI